ncbi:MAG: hypothetical protein R3D00_20680 [Bacteroidia bacterium]
MPPLYILIFSLLISCQLSGEHNPHTIKAEIELVEYQLLMLEVEDESEDSMIWGISVFKTIRIDQNSNRIIHFERNWELNFQMECFSSTITNLEVDKINELLDKIPDGPNFYDFPVKPTYLYCGPSYYLSVRQNSNEQNLLVGIPTEMPLDVTAMIHSLDMIAKNGKLIHPTGEECNIDEKEIIERIGVIDTSLSRIPRVMHHSFEIPAP